MTVTRNYAAEDAATLLRYADRADLIQGHRIRQIAERLRCGFYTHASTATEVFGLKVYEDSTLPPGAVVFHTQDGKPPAIVHIQPDDTEGGEA